MSKRYIAYNKVHKLCLESTEQIKKFNPTLIVAIGGGGFIPARILRTFLKEPGHKNIPIQAIGLSLYEDMGMGSDSIGKEVLRTQWLDFNSELTDSLIGRNVLIVDEVDDTRTTLHYAVNELTKDVAEQAKLLGRETEETKFFVFVLHNKDKPKRAQLPEDMMSQGRYLAAETVPDDWIVYPWDAMSIDGHTDKAKEQGNY